MARGHFRYAGLSLPQIAQQRLNFAPTEIRNASILKRNAGPTSKKVFPNDHPLNSDGHLIAGAADSAPSKSSWDSARNNPVVASILVRNCPDTNGLLAGLLTRAKCSTVALSPHTLPKTPSVFVRLAAHDSPRRDRHALACGV